MAFSARVLPWMVIRGRTSRLGHVRFRAYTDHSETLCMQSGCGHVDLVGIRPALSSAFA